MNDKMTFFEKCIKNTSKVMFILLVFASFSHALAQDKVEPNVGADFVSQYVWRGQNLAGVSIQPSLGISYKGISLSAWGSVGFHKDDTKEVDLSLSYAWKGLSFGVTDYWSYDEETKYFNYHREETSHTLEAYISYDFEYVAIAWYTNVYGSDIDSTGKQKFSSYAEISAPFSLIGIDWTATLGMVPYASEYYDTERFAVTNVSLRASKTISIKDILSLPIYAELIVNPHTQKVYFVAGIAISYP